MNVHLTSRPVATGRPDEPARRRFTADDVEQMVRAGVIHEEERVELIDGEIITMAAKGNRHEIVRSELIVHWARRLPDDIKFASEPAFRLSDHHQPEPDILLFPSSLYVPDVRGETALLVVEVSDTSISYDLKIKAPIYAAYGVREYWVIDARTLVTTAHRLPGADGYADVINYGPADLIMPLAVPALALRLADLGVDIA
jgi:Uma2 family endonuclease